MFSGISVRSIHAHIPVDLRGRGAVMGTDYYAMELEGHTLSRGVSNRLVTD